jgi:hypothetical protein
MSLPPIVVEIDGKRRERPQVIARATPSCTKEGEEGEEGEQGSEERKRAQSVQQQTRARMKETEH